MGWFFDLIEINKDKSIRSVEHGYFSSNFCNLKFFFDIHLIDGLRANGVISIIEESLANLNKDGYEMGIREEENVNWAWGVDKNGDLMPLYEQTGVLIFHLTNILSMLKKFPDSFFVLDWVSDKDLHFEVVEIIKFKESGQN